MTISSTTRKAGPYLGNGVATSFAFAFKVFEASDVVVTLTVVASGVESTLVLTTDYTVTLNPDQNASPGGSVTYNPSGTPMASTHKLTLTSAVANLQETDVINTGEIPLEVLEDSLDRGVILTQQVAEVVGRSLAVSLSDDTPAALPAAAARASKFLAFDTNGDPIAASGVTSVPVSAFMETVLDDTTASAARTTLDVPSKAEAILDALVDAKGDLIVGTAADTVARKAVGNNGETLVADSTQSDGLIWTPFASAQDNAIIGGEFSVAPNQRGTSFVSPATNAFTADRWRWSNTSAVVVSITAGQADAPTVAQAGKLLTKCLQIDVTTADASIAAGDTAAIHQAIEGFNFLPLAQRSMVLQFRHKHTKTGTYCASLRNSAGDRSYVVEYTQDAADTWEHASFIIPASPSAGTWDYTTGAGLYVSFSVLCGSTFQTTANAWQTGNFLGTANQVNAGDSTSNFMRFSDIDLRPGTVVLPVQSRTFQDELKLCQRYYQTYVNATDRRYGVNPNLYRASGTAADLYHDNFSLPVVMRLSPTAARIGSWTVSNCSQPAMSGQGPGNILMSFTNTAGGACQATATANTGWDADAELL